MPCSRVRKDSDEIGIVGSGFVGATAGQGVGREIVLIDNNSACAAAEADDIRHAVPFAHPLELRNISQVSRPARRPPRPYWHCRRKCSPRYR